LSGRWVSSSRGRRWHASSAIGCSHSPCRRARKTWRPCGNSLRLGKVTPVIDRTYPLREAPEAIRYLEVEHARAKVVITV
jgi:NADPH:quinone reductase-like Zn-dependent oxidoreductase